MWLNINNLPLSLPSSTSFLSILLIALTLLLHLLPSSTSQNAIYYVIVQSLSCVSFQPHGLQHARFPCSLPSPRICSNSCPLSQWCHPIISSSIIPFSSCLQSFPESGSFLMSWLLESGDQSIGASASASVLPMNIQDWFPLGFTSLSKRRIDIAVQENLKSLLQHHSSKASIHQCPAFFMVQLSHPYMITQKTIALTRWTIVSKVMSLLCNMLSKLVIAFLPRSSIF